MTIVVYKDGQMAGDGRVTIKDNVVTDQAKKIFRLKDGSLFGWAGHAGAANRLKDSVEKAIKLAKPGAKKVLPDVAFKGAEGILVDSEGSIYLYEGCTWQRLDVGEYATIGCGYVQAIVALDMGATAKEAVAAAVKRNAGCGGRIRTLDL